MIVENLDPISGYLNGGFPERSSNIRQPRAHKSAVKSCPVFNRISGQTYSGVPQNVQVLFRWPIFFAKPKSTNLTYPRKLTGTNGYKRNLYRGYQWYRTTLDCIIRSLVDKHPSVTLGLGLTHIRLQYFTCKII